MEFLRSKRPHLLLNHFVSLCLFVFIIEKAENTQSLSVSGLGSVLAMLTLPALLHCSSKTYTAQVKRADRHLAELNELYLSTVETLATAIDVKDQVTSGHIRRVQQSTLGLARDLGVTDSKQIRALECASLLHDLGKLVVPENILNKPGPLSWAEFEQMKQHASMGADILSKVHFSLSRRANCSPPS